MKQITMLLTLILAITACGGVEEESTGSASFVNRIKDWQEREAPLQEHLPERSGPSLEEDYARSKLWGIIKAHDTGLVEDEGPDYWQTSEEFEINGNKGDCEDISIYLYFWIRMNRSFPDNDVTMRVVNNYREGKDDYHTIISVYTEGDTIIIDNGAIRSEKTQHTKITNEFNLFAIW